MSLPILFEIPDGADSADRLELFVAFSRFKLDVLGARSNWDASSWDLSLYLPTNGAHRTKVLRWKLTKSKGGKEFSSEFSNFAKAYVCYVHSLNPKKSYDVELAALRIIYLSLQEFCENSDITRVSPDLLNHCVTLISQTYRTGAAYTTGRAVQRISEFLNVLGAVPRRFSWICPISRKADITRVGADFERNRRVRLPQAGAIDALAEAFARATEPVDVVVTSAAALLACAPSRIREVLDLPSDCLVERFDENGEVQYGLRWWPAKGAPPLVKWVPTPMQDVAREAVKRVQELLHDTRSVSAWHEANPNRMWLPSHLEHLRTEDVVKLSAFEGVLPYNAPCGAHYWMKNHGVPIIGNGFPAYVRFRDVERAVLKSLPRKFPVMNSRNGLKFSEALFVVPPNFFHATRGNFNAAVTNVPTQAITSRLGNANVHGTLSVFRKLGVFLEGGADVEIKSHQLRHWLNTVAQRGGLGQLDIAKWSGRKCVQQNEVYDHVSANELIEIGRAAGLGEVLGPRSEAMANLPVTRDSLSDLDVGAAHVTEYGYCVHDYAMSPCQKHADCLNCNEHVCRKGDQDKTARISEQLALARRQVRDAERAESCESFGAGRWLEHHRRTVDRLKQLVEVLNDPAVPIGTIIRLSNSRDQIGTASQKGADGVPGSISLVSEIKK
jgi:hypothetical protein